MSLRPLKRAHLIAALLAALATSTMATGVGAQAQPSFDVLRVEQDGAGLPYAVWLSWSPEIVTTADGGAWAFFSADPLLGANGEPTDAAGERGLLYAARFDPATSVWQPATAFPGGAIQFGPAAVVGGDGTVHLVYTNRATTEDDAFGTLVYSRSDGNGGWTEPVPVAPDANAGHQLAATAVLDGQGQLHVVWQDQRQVDEAARQAAAANADIFASSLNGDSWTAAVPVSRLTVPEENASRPHIAAEGDRLVAVWSVYGGAAGESLDTAVRLEWSSRAIGDEEWSDPQAFVEPVAGTEMGGRLLDIDSHPEGGAAFIYGRRVLADDEANVDARTDLFLRRFNGDGWDEDIQIATGDRGTFPQMQVTSDGTVYAVYNVGSGGVGAVNIHAGVLTVAPDATAAGEEVVVTLGEFGAQGRPVAAVADDGTAWILYLHQPPGYQYVTEVRCQRELLLTEAPS